MRIENGAVVYTPAVGVQWALADFDSYTDTFFYAASDAMPDLASSRYFSAVTYTTSGYGDLVLPPEWRLVGGVEALTGSLMCGLSTGFFFAVVGRAYGDKTV